MHGKYIYDIYLNGEYIGNVYDANVSEGWVRTKILHSDGPATPSFRIEGAVKIIKNYNW